MKTRINAAPAVKGLKHLMTRVLNRNETSSQRPPNAGEVRHSLSTRQQPRACEEPLSERSQVNLSYKKLENKTYTNNWHHPRTEGEYIMTL